MGEELKCWICRRTFEDALRDFQEQVRSDSEIGEDIKSKFVEGEKEFFPTEFDRHVSFKLADVKKGYSITGEDIGRVCIYICPVCSGLFESIATEVDEMIKNKVSREELENVTIRIGKDSPC